MPEIHLYDQPFKEPSEFTDDTDTDVFDASGDSYGDDLLLAPEQGDQDEYDEYTGESSDERDGAPELYVPPMPYLGPVFGATFIRHAPIKDRLADEIAFQESVNFTPTPDLPHPAHILHGGYHDLNYLPPTDERCIAHAVLLNSPEEVLEFYDAAEDLSGGRFPTKHAFVAHERAHAEALLHLGQTSIRYIGRVEAHPTTLHLGRRVRPLDAKVSTLMEDIDISPVGIAVVRLAPEEPSDSDFAGVDTLQLTPEQAHLLARAYNVAHPGHYPIRE